jgi:predicted O-methyltransferase YrrM
VRARRDEIFASDDCGVPGVELNAAGQLRVLQELSPLVAEHPFPIEKGATRYYFDNGFFSYADALALYGMLRRLRPQRYVEIGSGFSSAIALDVNERHFGGAMEILLVEPYPERLLELLRPGDLDRVELVREPLHRIPTARFAALQPGDVLFIDSTHVSKVGSDVNRVFFEILPRLPAGVHVHVHDVFFPFEYPEQWILEGRAWNEAYVLRAFLQYNRAFEIVLFNDYLAKHQRDALLRLAPLFLKNTGGSVWLRKI